MKISSFQWFYNLTTCKGRWSSIFRVSVVVAFHSTPSFLSIKDNESFCSRQWPRVKQVKLNINVTGDCRWTYTISTHSFCCLCRSDVGSLPLRIVIIAEKLNTNDIQSDTQNMRKFEKWGKKVSMERIEIFKGFSLTVLHTHRMSRHESKISANFNILRSISIFATNKFNLKITESDLFRCAFWMDLSVSVRVLRCSVWSLIFSNHRAWLISSIMLESWISK